MRCMHVERFMAETVLRAAVTAVQQGGWELRQTLDTLPVPIYVTDPDGVVTYFNRACVGFAGRPRALARIAGALRGNSTPRTVIFCRMRTLPDGRSHSTTATRERRRGGSLNVQTAAGLASCPIRPPCLMETATSPAPSMCL